MKRKTEMPKVNMKALAGMLLEHELELVKMFIKADGSIRASKPKPPKKVKYYTSEVTQTEYGPYHKHYYDYANDEDGKRGIAAYIWRQVVFFVSPKRAHQCMPTMDICDLPKSVTNDGYTMSNKQLERLHEIADMVVNCVEVKDWHGVKRWGQAFGQIGTPQLRQGGTIVYR